jgi:hypothetical protein
MKTTGFAPLLAALLAGLSPAAAQQTFHVSPVGRDDHPGTREQPFATLTRARDAVRRVNRGMKGDILVYLRAGTHRLHETVEFDARDSGTGGHRVVYQAYPDETPVLSGGVEIAGWRPHEKGLWKAPVRGLNFRQLYVNGRRATRARQPNAGDYHRLVLWDLEEKEILVPGAEVRPWRQFRQVEMVVQMAWAEAILRLDSVRFTGDGKNPWVRPAYARIAPQQPERDLVFARDYPPKQGGQVYHFENAYEFLDEPGEWYLDRAADVVYYRPRPGEDPSLMEVVAPRVETLVRVRGTREEPVRGLVFRGITFEHTTWLRPSEQGHLTLQAFQYTIPPTAADEQHVARPPAAVLVEATEGIVFERNVFRRLGATALDLHMGTAGCRVVGNAFHDIAGNGVSVGVFSPPDAEVHVPYQPADPREVCRDDVVSHNYIFRVGRDYPGSCGIAAGHPRGLVVEHNEIAYLPYTGISVGWGWRHLPNAMADNVIRANHVHHVMQMLCDGGGIYTLSLQPGTVIERNYIHDLAKSPWAGESGLKAIYLDEGSGGTREKPMVVRHNVVATARDIVKHNFHRAGLVLYEFNTQRVERVGECDGRRVVEEAGPRPPYPGMRRHVEAEERPGPATRDLVYMTELKDEAEAIKAYDYYHSAAGCWPEMTHAARVSGFVKIRIYRFGNRLVMIQTIPVGADLDEINRRYADSSERTKEWGALMSKFQQPPPGAPPGQVWVPMRLIYDYEHGRLR